MKSPFRVVVDSRNGKLRLQNLKGAISNLRPAFINFQAYMHRLTALMFSRLRQGGSFRGETWPEFAEQYRRKDGTIIPAEGGVGKVRGEGKVLGRKRHSGKRVTSSSSLMRDTGRMSIAALTKSRMTKTRLEMDTPVKYAVFQNRLRPFQFFEIPQDANALRRFVLKVIKDAG